MLPPAVNVLLGSGFPRCQIPRLEKIGPLAVVAVDHTHRQDGPEVLVQSVHSDHPAFLGDESVHVKKGIHVQMSEKMLALVLDCKSTRDECCFCHVVVHGDCDWVLPWARWFHWCPTWRPALLLVGGRVD